MIEEVEVEIEARCACIDMFGNRCEIACISTFINGKCKDIIITDLANLIDYAKRH